MESNTASSVSRSGRIRKKSSKLADFFDADDEVEMDEDDLEEPSTSSPTVATEPGDGKTQADVNEPLAPMVRNTY